MEVKSAGWDREKGVNESTGEENPLEMRMSKLVRFAVGGGKGS
jgi:hypothetical protein